MRHRTLLAALSLVTVALSGCLAGLLEGDQPEDRTTPGPADEHDLGAPETHGEPSIVWGPVQTEQEEDGGWRAWQVATITNDFGGAMRSILNFTTTSGGIVVAPLGQLTPPQPVDGPVGYLILANRTATGPTEDEAVRSMEAVDVVHEDRLDDGTLHLSTHIEPVPSDPTRIEPEDLLGLVGGANRGGSLQVALPRQPTHELVARSTSGGVVVSDLSFTTLDARTNSGGVVVEDVDANSVHAETGSGGVIVGGGFSDLVAKTTSGGVEAHATPTGTGSYQLETNSGGIVLTLSGDRDNGYDVEASTTSGSVSISIPNGEEVGEQTGEHQHVRTRGYGDKPIRTDVDATTTSGGVVVTG